MVQFAGGQVRLSVRARSGDRIVSSDAVDYTIADNAATPRWVINGTGATTSDQAYGWQHLVHGPVGEYLSVDFYHTAAVTIDTSACTFKLPIMRFMKDPRRGVVSDPDLLQLGDRMTKSTSGTINDPRGINDDRTTIANEWTPIAVFPIGAGENAMVSGFVQVLIDGA